MTTPRVSIVVRTKDRPAMLPRALSSIGAQTFPDWRVCIVNDGGSRLAVEDVVARVDPALSAKVDVVNNPMSLGMEAAGNCGVAASASALVALLDDDDTWDPAFLARTVAFLESDPFGLTCVGVATQSNIVIERASGGDFEEVRRVVMNGELRKLTLFRVAGRNPITNNALLFRRSAFERAGRFAEDLPVLGDWDFLLRLLAIGDIGVIPEPLANYHQRETLGAAGDANSFAGRINRHDHYDAQIQNKHMRAAFAGEHVAKALAMGAGRELDELRRELERLAGRVSGIEQTLRALASPLKWTARVLAKAWSRVGRAKDQSTDPKE